MKKKVILGLVVLALVAMSAIYYEYSAYENEVVLTTVVTGKITGFQSSAVPAGQNGATAGATFVTISITSTNATFSQLISCTTFPFYAGLTVKVADQLLRSGAHQYLPDIACKGTTSPFKSYQASQTTTSTT